ncbi:patatin-like phospholipase family protein [Roseivirga sp. E12]|uniref:patatin-like phospholipase family protein n=1 Tax=Roseivirga sp. E12 TaxID=2819237 RepID=UPI001ABC2135|nr:patatin-like phospholipase family protein [Roseivirga sp. E12]MBO3699941.1 patatin-like phospholipase family protein [Roseivirga sp. E12]
MRFLTIFFLVTFSLSSFGQRVGLVLSGGGAKGIAHIGVLKALEENDIPIDYIVGTSMGAVVGAFYAAGYSPEEIELLVRNPSFQDWINGTSTEKYQYNYTKAEDNASWLSLDLLLNANKGPTINTPLANDIILNFVLNEYLTQAAQSAGFDFDKLLIPYRSVAADVFTQKTIAIDSGSIMQAVRSSMAVPLFYRPVKYQNQYLFDGGIYDNFPVDIMRDDFSPDLIIGSNVATKKSPSYPFEKDEELISDVLLYMFLDKTDSTTLGEGDIYIEPEVFQFNATDFDKADIFIDAGYKAAQEQISNLKTRLSTNTGSSLTDKRAAFRERFQGYTFGALDLFGFDSQQQGFMRKLIDFNEGTKSLEEIKGAYFQLVSEPYFKNIYPNFNYDKEAGYYVLELYLKPTAKNALSVDFGGNLSTRRVSTLQLGMTLNSFRKKLNTYKARLSTGRFYEGVNLATRFNINPKNRFFIEPAFTFNHWDYLSTDDVFDRSAEPVIINRIDRKIGVTAGLGLGQRSVVTVSVNGIRNSDEFANQVELSSTDFLDELELTAFKAELAYERNSLNKKQFPTIGTRFYSSFKYFSGSSDYKPGTTSVLFNPINAQLLSSNRNWFSFRLGFDEYSQVSERYTFGWMFQGEYSNIDPLDNYRSTLLYLPSFGPLFDAQTYFLEDFIAPGYLSVGMKHILNIRKNLDFRFELYAYSPFKRIRTNLNQEAIVENGFKSPTFQGMAALIYKTPLGPLTFRLNYIENNNVQFGLMLSFGYLIFNPKSYD